MDEPVLPFWLKQRAYLTPHRIALITEENRYTFAQLDQEASLMATRLQQRGVEAGCRVALLASNSPLTVVLIHALSYSKAVLIPLNNRLTGSELAWQINDAQAHFVIYDESFRDKVDQFKEDIACPLVESRSLLHGVQNHEVICQPRNFLSLNELHTIMYTSGTSGRPKGAMLTYGNHFWSAIGSVLNLGLEKEDCWLCCVPLFHVSGLSILMRSVIYGMTVVLLPRFDPVQVNQWIPKYKVTHISVVSTMLASMLHHLDTERYPEHLRVILLGGGPAPKPLLQACMERSLPVYQTYGLTETASQIVTLAPEDVDKKVNSAGKPLFPAEVRIMKDGRILPSGEIGEIVVRGPNVTKGYFRREEATKEALRDGWFHTGDMGYLDNEGYLYVLDRRSDLIISGGENVYPAEVESVLMEHPLVKEAGVIGQPDPKWGEVPVGFVVKQPDSPLSEEELIHFCQKRLARYKIPRIIRFVDQLPRNASNKLLRRELRQLLSQPFKEE